MTTTDRDSSTLVDIPSTPEARFSELATILAAGLLRLRNRPELASEAPDSGSENAPRISAETASEPLGLTAHLVPHVRNG